ncbi:MAG: efflux transporter periplasmic adaptor subunit [Verrucomicrobiaceae bacterium]|nr:efflux transporter periplasmic adaptor subunit [Verrucomicrobiaceae bacterium]
MTNLKVPPIAAFSGNSIDANSNASASSFDAHPTSGHSVAESHKHTLKYAKGTALVALILLIVAVGIRALVNYNSSEALEAHNSASLLRTVIIAHAAPGELVRNVALPTTLRGYTETSIYARSNGYLTAWHKSIGDFVKKGELLATIDAPEQEQELAQLKAAQQQISARLDLSRLTLKRWESLRIRDGVSQQELEEKRSEVIQAQADLNAANANVKRVEQLEGFRRIVAPFNGVITRRGVEVGDLVSAGGKELFALTQTDPLRLSIWVPQVYASDVKIGEHVAIALNELPNAQLTATIERVAGGIDAQTRSRQVDLILPNPDATLLPGAYAEVNIKLSSGVEALIAPASTLMSTDEGFRVAVVDANNQIAFRPIKLGRDLGREVEILSGIAPTDTLVVSPSDLLVEGETVKTLAWEGKTSGDQGRKNKETKTRVEKKNEQVPNDEKTGAAKTAVGDKRLSAIQ